jgi:hypothetical protein
MKKKEEVVFCIPGKYFSNNFLVSWSRLLLACGELGIIPHISNAYDPNIYKVRNKCLMGDENLGQNQKPFQGKIDYDFIMWIDSDMVFEVKDFRNLLETMRKNKNIHILAGVYLGAKGDYTAGKAIINQYGKKEVKVFTPSDLDNKSELIEVDYSGMGFMMVRKGVLEALSYPWFYPIIVSTPLGVVGFITEDIGFCLNAKKKNFATYIDPKIKVGHEKPKII